MSLAQVSHKKEALKRDIALLAQRSSNGLIVNHQSRAHSW